MTRCTSLSHGYSLNSIAFRANTGMSQAEFIASGAQQLHRTDLANDVQIPRIGAQTRKPSSPWINYRRVSAMLSPWGSPRPHGFLLVMFPNAGPSCTKTKTRAQARIEKP